MSDDSLTDAGMYAQEAQTAYERGGPSPDVTAKALLSIANSLLVLAALEYDKPS